MPPRSPAPSPAPAKTANQSANKSASKSAKAPTTTARAPAKPAKPAVTGPSGQEPKASPANRLKVGDRAPEFALPADDGR
ncbi:MAG TPA: hypothetical protein VGB85_04325, partial [Nannocystis sp.]